MKIFNYKTEKVEDAEKGYSDFVSNWENYIPQDAMIQNWYIALLDSNVSSAKAAELILRTIVEKTNILKFT